MPVRSSPTELPAVVSVSDMARRVGLSRSRFYELIQAGIFPPPVYCIRTHRPMYLTEHQAQIAKTRTNNIGANGQFVLFYAARTEEPTQRRRSRVAADPESNRLTDELVDGLRALGLTSVTQQEVATAIQCCFPQGRAGRDEGEVLRACWSHFRRTGAA